MSKATNQVEAFHPSKHANKFKVTVRKSAKHRDLAILDIGFPQPNILSLIPYRGRSGLAIQRLRLDIPVGHRRPLNIRPGVVSTLTVKSAIHLIEVTQKLTQGMSGGPLLDANDAVAGKIHKGGPEEGRDFAVDIRVLEDWLKEG